MTAHGVYYQGSPYYAMLHDRYGSTLPAHIAQAVAVEHGTSIAELEMRPAPLTLDLVMALGY